MLLRKNSILLIVANKSREQMTDPYQTPRSEIELPEQPLSLEHQIYSPLGLALATFVGGVLACSFLLLTNLEQMGKKTLGVLFIAIASLLSIFVVFFGLISPFGAILSYLLVNFVAAILVLFWSGRLMQRLQDQFESSGGVYYSSLRALFFGCLSSLALLLMLLLAAEMFARL